MRIPPLVNLPEGGTPPNVWTWHSGAYRVEILKAEEQEKRDREKKRAAKEPY